MSKLMAHVAGLSSGGVRVVMHNQPPVAVKNGDGGEYGPSKLAEVTISPLCRLLKIRKPDDRNLKPLRQPSTGQAGQSN